jgi:hypothetical protein
MHATATFTIDDWQQDALDDAPGAPLSRARVRKTFSGDLEATSATEILLAGDPSDENARAYLGVERITGTLGARSGSFVLIHSAVAAGDDSHVAWTILPGSGTDELTEIRGSAELSVDTAGGHSIGLDYEL